jgi:hypothetical protein
MLSFTLDDDDDDDDDDEAPLLFLDELGMIYVCYQYNQ